MTISFFVPNQVGFQINERLQIERIADHLYQNFKDEEENLYVVLDFIKGSSQYDIIVIKANSVVILETKDYSGIITGNENNNWRSTDDIKGSVELNSNPYRQAQTQRFTLIRYLSDTLKEIDARFSQGITNIAVFVCFNDGSTYDTNQIDQRANIWFRVIEESGISDLIKSWDSRQYLLRDSETLSLLYEMGVIEIDSSKIVNTREDEKKAEERDDSEEVLKDGKISVKDSSNLTIEEIEKVTTKIVKLSGGKDFSLQQLTEIVEPEAAIAYLTESLETKIIVNAESDQKFKINEDWEDVLLNLFQARGKVISGLDIFDQDFWMRPKESKEKEVYEGIYRGTKYTLDSNYKIWWKKGGKANIKVGVSIGDSSTLKKIENTKFLGGSFRITEKKEILAKILRNDAYIPVYIGHLAGKIELDQLDWEPKGLKPGDLWPSVYDGTELAVNSNGDLLIHIGERKVCAVEGHEELAQKILEFRKHGGRFKINENGIILTLMYQVPYPTKIRKQLEGLSDFQKNLIDIRQKIDGDGMVPIFIGKFVGNIKFKKALDMDKKWSEEDDKEFLKRMGVD